MNTTQDDGGPIAPNMTHEIPMGGDIVQHVQLRAVGGLSIRDWFARTAPHDEVSEMTYRHLSRNAQERLAGITYPTIDREARGDQAVNQQIAEMMFHARVNAALRYISADAMLAVRKEKL
jgi:hypothetical protein